jgi:hypothetical protein
VEFLHKYRCPSTPEEFAAWYYINNMDLVGELMLLSYRMGRIEKLTPFQIFVLGMYCGQYGGDICPECGLNFGPWCGKLFPHA